MVAVVCATFWEYGLVLDPKLVDDVSSEPTASKASGIQLFVFGLIFLAGAFLASRKEWDWLRVNAVLVGKQFQGGRAVLTLEFEAAGQGFTSRLIRADSERSQSNILVGKWYEIIYNPKDPGQIATVPRRGRGDYSSILASLGLLVIIAGLAIYDESG